MSKKLTSEEFIARAKSVHMDKYNYSKVNYINSYTKVTITCLIHGDFEQKTANHLQGKGCSNCANEKLSKERALSHSQVIQKCTIIHNNKYTYNLDNYKNAHSKITITCAIHGTFEQTVSAHMHRQDGCPKCAIINRGLNNRLDIDTFMERSLRVHGYRYDYSSVNYIGWDTKVTIICKEHGPFQQSPRDHFDGCGCQQCATHGFNPSKAAYLYYLKVITDSNQVLYKIGVTNRTVESRFSSTDLTKIEIIKLKLYESGQDAWDWEQLFKKKYKEYQYKGSGVLSSGNTELYIEDIYSKFIKEFQ